MQDPSEPFVIPNGITNIDRLRLLTADQIGTEEDRPLTPRELVALSWLVGKALKPTHGEEGYLSDLMQHVNHQFWQDGQPRFTALHGWLQPHGLITKFPNAVIAIAQFIVGDTYRETMAAPNWDAIRLEYPHLTI